MRGASRVWVQIGQRWLGQMSGARARACARRGGYGYDGEDALDGDIQSKGRKERVARERLLTQRLPTS